LYSFVKNQYSNAQKLLSLALGGQFGNGLQLEKVKPTPFSSSSLSSSVKPVKTDCGSIVLLKPLLILSLWWTNSCYSCMSKVFLIETNTNYMTLPP